MDDHPNQSPQSSSPTLLTLNKSVPTVCARCSNSMWFGSEKVTKCFCRVMHALTWSGDGKDVVTHCDGIFLGAEEEEVGE